jgi:hypothetical protein
MEARKEKRGKGLEEEGRGILPQYLIIKSTPMAKTV